MDDIKRTGSSRLRGFITEVDFPEAEQEFPGITRYYRTCKDKPATFLDLLAAFLRAGTAVRAA
jgi:hypothetical protein